MRIQGFYLTLLPTEQALLGDPPGRAIGVCIYQQVSNGETAGMIRRHHVQLTALVAG